MLQPVAPARSPQRPDLEALLLMAVREQRRQGCLQLIQHWVHRRGLADLERYCQQVLPTAVGEAPVTWLTALLREDPLTPPVAESPQASRHPGAASPTASLTAGPRGGAIAAPESRAATEPAATRTVSTQTVSTQAESMPTVALQTVAAQSLEAQNGPVPTVAAQDVAAQTGSTPARSTQTPSRPITATPTVIGEPATTAAPPVPTAANKHLALDCQQDRALNITTQTDSSPTGSTQTPSRPTTATPIVIGEPAAAAASPVPTATSVPLALGGEQDRALAARAEAAVDAAFAALAETFPEAIERPIKPQAPALATTAAPAPDATAPHPAAAPSLGTATDPATTVSPVAARSAVPAMDPIPARGTARSPGAAEAPDAVASPAGGSDHDLVAPHPRSSSPKVPALGSASREATAWDSRDTAGWEACSLEAPHQEIQHQEAPAQEVEPPEAQPQELQRQESPHQQVLDLEVPALAAPTPWPEATGWPDSTAPPAPMAGTDLGGTGFRAAPAAWEGLPPWPSSEPDPSSALAESPLAASGAAPSAAAASPTERLMRWRGGLRRRGTQGLNALRSLMRDCLEETVSMLQPPSDNAPGAASPPAAQPHQPLPPQDPFSIGATPPPLAEPAGTSSAIPAWMPPPQPTAPAAPSRPRQATPKRQREESNASRPAPAPAALSDLRAWLPDPDDLPRAS